MLKSMMKFRILFMLTLMLQFVATPLNPSAEEVQTSTIDYLALGDSLAAGLSSENVLGNGYTDYLAEILDDATLLKSFFKGFSVPGYTSTQVLLDLDKPEVQESIMNAELITISAGANDALAHITFDSVTGKSTIDFGELTKAIQKVGENYALILNSIYTLNPGVEVYIMGYYNPFPHIPDPVLQGQLTQLLTSLNNSILAGMTNTTAVLVPTADKISENPIAYLPNPSNIHLSKTGYKEVAAQFAVQMNLTPPVTFPDIGTNEFKGFIEEAVELGLINGHTDGTFKPGNELTRAQAAAIIVRALRLETNESAPFSDISGYAEETQAEIAAAYKAGIVKGSNGKFHPSTPVTRTQLALMIKRTYELISKQPYVATETAPFTDIIQLDDEAKNSISMLYEFKIANGSNGMFMPSNPTTRGQAAKMFVNTKVILNNLK
ncbi:S-layer homology domain-containing protein [Sporosarcina sp. CAU 1771]